MELNYLEFIESIARICNDCESEYFTFNKELL